MALLGIDLGTSSVKVVVLTVDGELLSSAQATYPLSAPHLGWVESDPAHWWVATVSATRAALTHAPNVAITAIGLSGQMHGVVLADATGQPLRPAILWADTRATAELNIYQALPAALRQVLANPLVPGMAGPLLYWLAHYEASAYHAARWAWQPKDWLRWQLTGSSATDPSDASATLLYNVAADDWSDDIIAALDVRRDLCAPILPSAAIAGDLTPAAATALGLSAGIPVAAGGADTAVAALGTGLLTAGPVQLTVGTGAQIIQLITAPADDPTGRTHLYRAADGRHWYRMAAVQNAGFALEWVCQTLDVTWNDLFASAIMEPEIGGVRFLPYLTDERTQHSALLPAGGAWLGLRAHHRREHLLHAALAGVAFGMRFALESLPDVAAVTAMRLAGGGSEHLAWRQMLADILGRELWTVATTAASARGAALLAGIATQAWADAQATAAIVPQLSLAAQPDASRNATFQSQYEAYVQSIYVG